MHFLVNDTATTYIYTLSLHDALPIFLFGTAVVLFIGRFEDQTDADALSDVHQTAGGFINQFFGVARRLVEDRKSTRLNSSHRCISYAVFCLKKKTKVSSRLS